MVPKFLLYILNILYSFVTNMSTVQVIVFLMLINGYYCDKSCAKIGSLMDGRVKVVIFTKINWRIQTFLPDTRYHIIKSEDNDDLNSIDIMFYCETFKSSDFNNIFQKDKTQRNIICQQNEIEVWRNSQVNFKELEDIALYYTCNTIRNSSVLMLLQDKNTNLSKTILNDKIGTIMTNVYRHIEAKNEIDNLYQINDDDECQKYLDDIGCGHFIKLKWKSVNNVSYSTLAILLFVLILWILVACFCCNDNK